MTPATSPRRARYGIDAPYMIPIPIIVVAANIVLYVYTRSTGPIFSTLVCIFLLACSFHTSRRGKFIVWKKLLDDLNLRGDERILDIGCGRGAVLIEAAKHLTIGAAVGVDVWRKRDQLGNSDAATRANADIEGVSHRITLVTADARSLPFADGKFDLIVSSIAIHNINGISERARAIDEAVRVLKPGGRLLIADLWQTKDYLRRVAELGMINVTRRNLGWRMWWGGPWVPTRVVSGTKPLQGQPVTTLQGAF